jgi:hypothetical protein
MIFVFGTCDFYVHFKNASEKHVILIDYDFSCEAISM